MIENIIIEGKSNVMTIINDMSDEQAIINMRANILRTAAWNSIKPNSNKAIIAWIVKIIDIAHEIIMLTKSNWTTKLREEIARSEP